MNQAQKLINAAFENLLRIPVSGDGVEKMASAKAFLSQAYQEAGRYQDVKGETEDGK